MGKLKPESPINLMVKNHGFRLRFSHQSSDLSWWSPLFCMVNYRHHGAAWRLTALAPQPPIFTSNDFVGPTVHRSSPLNNSKEKELIGNPLPLIMCNIYIYIIIIIIIYIYIHIFYYNIYIYITPQTKHWWNLFIFGSVPGHCSNHQAPPLAH